MTDGWIKLHRATLDNPIVCKDSDHLAVWVYLLMKVTHREYDTIFNGERYTLKPGQQIFGRKSISVDLKVSESKVQRILKTFESEQQIEQQTTSKNRLISILNWDKYQDSEQLIEQRLNNKRTTTEQQVNTNNNTNNTNNDNKDIYAESVERIWDVYPNKKGKVQAIKKIPKLIKEHGEEKIIRAVQRYADEVKGTDPQYIKHGSTFFNGGIVDYLSDDYTAPAKKFENKGKPISEFNNYDQRTYDYDALEKKMLGRDE